jgi:hypothetical protein
MMEPVEPTIPNDCKNCVGAKYCDPHQKQWSAYISASAGWSCLVDGRLPQNATRCGCGTCGNCLEAIVLFVKAYQRYIDALTDEEIVNIVREHARQAVFKRNEEEEEE